MGRIRTWARSRAVSICDQIVYASGAYVDLKSMTNQLAGDLIDLSRSPVGDRDRRLLQAADLLRPIKVAEDRLIRVGGDDDGGYVMLDDFDVDGAISIGVGPDVSWDADIAARGIPVALFDHTVSKLPAEVPGGRFYRVGVGEGGVLRSLAGLVELAGFHGDNLLLKIDVEGAEWSSAALGARDQLSRFRQISCELHGLELLGDTEQAPAILDTLSAVAETHVAVHLHANNYSPIVRFDDLWFPSAVEVSFVRRDLISELQPAVRVLTALDRPNDPRVAEIRLEGVLGRGD